MILVDTSVWVDHFRRKDETLARLLDGGGVVMHRFVLGELAMGGLRNRSTVLALMQDLPAAKHATDDEVLHFIERQRLMGAGIGYLDAHLLASAALTPSTALWTRDRRLAAVARRLNLEAAL